MSTPPDDSLLVVATLAGPAPATPLEQRTVQAFADARARAVPEDATASAADERRGRPEAMPGQDVPGAAAHAGDHDTLLSDFLAEYGSWHTYRPCDETTILQHEDCALRVEFVHEATGSEPRWSIAAYTSPVGPRTWLATASSTTPAGIVASLLHTVASGTPIAIGDGVTDDETDPQRIVQPLTDANWHRTVARHRLVTWHRSQEPSAGLMLDAFVALRPERDDEPAWTAYGSAPCEDSPAWTVRLSAGTPPAVVHNLAFELAELAETTMPPVQARPAPARTAERAAPPQPSPSPARPPR